MLVLVGGLILYCIEVVFCSRDLCIFTISASAKLRGIENCSLVLHNMPSISTHIPTHVENKGYPSVRILNLDNAGSGDGR